MYCIRGLKTSLSKITHPTGEVSSLGTMAVMPSFKFVKDGNGGYAGTLFGKSEENPTPWSITNEIITSVDGKGVVTARHVGVQPRKSDNGTMLPHNTTDRFVGATFANWVYSYDSQRFSLYRNSVPLSPVNEITVFQTKVKKNISIYSENDLVRLDPSVIAVDATAGELINVQVQRAPEWKDSAGITAVKNDISGAFVNTSNENIFADQGYGYYISGYNGFYNGLTKPDDVSYRGVEICFASNQIIQYKDVLNYVYISFGGLMGTVRIYITPELKAKLLTAASLKTYVVFRFNVGFTRGYLDDPTNLPEVSYRESLQVCLQHGSDFLPEETVVSPDGEFVILKFNRLTKVDVLFNNVEHGFDYISDINNEIKVTRRDKKFTTGGVLQITQKHRLKNAGTNKVYTFTIPDTVPPDQPMFTSATRTIIYGTGTRGDIVYVEREGEVLGSATINTTGTFELTVANTTFSNGETIVLYTKDAANNKSPETIVVLDSIASETRIDATINSDVMQQIGYHS